LIIARLVCFWVMSSVYPRFLWVSIQVDLILVKYRRNLHGSTSNNFSILQMQVLIFVIGDKTEIATPWSKGCRMEIRLNFLDKVFCLAGIPRWYTAYTDIEFVDNNSRIDVLRIIQKTEIVV